MPVFTAPLFAVNSSKFSKSYLFDSSEFVKTFDDNDSLIFPICHDSEWVNKPIDDFLLSDDLKNRNLLATQVRQIFDKPLCFFPIKAIQESGHNFLYPLDSDFAICDYLKKLGIESYIDEIDSDTIIPTMEIKLYTFFGLVDLMLLAKPDSILYQFFRESIATGKIKHDKRLTTNWNKAITSDIVLNIADIDNDYHSYRLKFSFIDAGAIFGNMSYKKACQIVGLDVSAKSLMDNYKSNMDIGLKLYPYEFIEYANGDLNVYDLLVAYNDMMKTVYDDLDLSDFFLNPKLSIGSTCADLLSASIFKWRELSANEYHAKNGNKLVRKAVISKLMELSSADYLKTQTLQSDIYLLGKVQGGRCHNNNPLFRYQENSAFADVDLMGAYGNTMQILLIYTGQPWFYNGYDENITLKEFSKKYLKDFDNRSYEIIVSTNELLDYEQDFLTSWCNFSAKKERITLDNGDNDYVNMAKYETGYTHIFKREVINCPIDSDTMICINSLSKRVKDDLMNKLIVKSAMGYKRSEKDIKWFSTNLGELLITPLLKKRKYYKKLYKETNDSRYDNMQNLYKLIINTMYGDLCSRFFTVSNVLTANHITQIIRLAMYLKEKGLNLLGSITDGCIMDLNRVVYALHGRKLYLNNLVNLYKDNSDTLNANHIRIAPLDNALNIQLIWNELDEPITIDEKVISHLPQLTITYKDRIDVVKDELRINGKEFNIVKNVNAWIDDKTWNHLRMLFPDFTYLFDFLKIETKDVYSSCAYHGAANYEVSNPNYSKQAMRGYTAKKTCIGIALENDSIVKTDFYKDSNIPIEFLKRLHSENIEKLPPFIKPTILKAKEFVHKNFYDKSTLNCGDETITVGMANLFSISQFTFQTYAQYEKWKELMGKLKLKYGETFELFFTNKNGLVQYDLMIKTLCDLVDNNSHKPISELNKNFYIKKEKSERFMTKLKACELRNKLTFTIDENKNEDDYFSFDDRRD